MIPGHHDFGTIDPKQRSYRVVDSCSVFTTAENFLQKFDPVEGRGEY